jgi:hypothetical protein
LNVFEIESLDNPQPRRGITRQQWTLVTIILALAIAGVLYRVFVVHKLEQTSALFIGLPAVLAIVLTLAPAAKSATGLIMKTTTIALLMSGPILGEGFICIIMAAPLFYLVGAVIGLVVDHRRRKEKSLSLQVVVLLPILLASLEGTTPTLTFPTREEVTVRKIVSGSPADVERALARKPVFDEALPPFLRMKFPLPVSASGEGLSVGAERRIHFAGGEGKPGDLTMRVTGRDASSVTFTAESDTSHIAHWLTWRTSHVAWRAAGPARTEVTWTIVYDRELDPAWYFAPWERYATRLAAEVLIDNLAATSR